MQTLSKEDMKLKRICYACDLIEINHFFAAVEQQLCSRKLREENSNNFEILDHLVMGFHFVKLKHLEKKIL